MSTHIHTHLYAIHTHMYTYIYMTHTLICLLSSYAFQSSQRACLGEMQHSAIYCANVRSVPDTKGRPLEDLLRTSRSTRATGLDSEAMMAFGCWFASQRPHRFTWSPASGALWKVVRSTWRKWVIRVGL